MTYTPLLEKFPLGIRGLVSLQTLSKVVIQEDDGLKISDLKGLKDLQGELSIEGLEKVIDPIEAKDANLQQKKGLDNLKLVWGDAFPNNTTNEDDVIEKLRPHPKLKTLSIKGYTGMKFPSWLGDPSFDQLTHLMLSDCKNCTELATLGPLTLLRELRIYNCPKFVSIKGDKEVVNVGSSIMGSLRHVTLLRCDSLESYCCPTSVEFLQITECDSMASLTFSKLQKDFPSSPSNLKTLWIYNCKNIKSIFQENSQSLTSLEDMQIYKCPRMGDSFPSCGSWPPNLRKLRIEELKKPLSEWGPQNYPSSLVELVLSGRHSGVVSFGIDEQDYNNMSSSCFLLPPSLTYLEIWEFEEMESVSEVLQHLPQLQNLHIRKCPKLRDVPKTTSSLKVNVSTR